MTSARTVVSVLLLLAAYAVFTIGWPIMAALAQTDAYYPISAGLWTLSALLVLLVRLSYRKEIRRG